MKLVMLKPVIICAGLMLAAAPMIDSSAYAKPNQSLHGSKGKCKAKKAQILRLIARMGDDDTGAAAKAVYEEKTLGNSNVIRKFTAEVENAMPGDTYDVSVNGQLVGTITIGSEGEGELELRMKPEGDELPLPGDFPGLKAGDSVQIGEFMSTFQAK